MNLACDGIPEHRGDGRQSLACALDAVGHSVHGDA